MPATNFPEYAQRIGRVLAPLLVTGEATLVSFQADQRSSLRGFITGVVRFDDRSELHFREFVDASRFAPRLMYAYHYQDSHEALIFRYDNAAHRPQLPQSEHKHTPSHLTISDAPTLAQVIEEILSG